MSAAVTMLTNDATSLVCWARFDPATTISIFISCSRSMVLESAVFGVGGVGCWAAARPAEMSTLPNRKALMARQCQYGIVIWFIGERSLPQDDERSGRNVSFFLQFRLRGSPRTDSLHPG